jgi:hypothetical protein
MANKEQRTRKRRAEHPVGDPEQDRARVLLTERPLLVQDDEEEVHDLGFIIDDRDDHRSDLLEPFQRLETLDTDEPLETNRTGPLPREAQRLRREAVLPDEYPVDFRIANREAERDEDEFADANQLIAAPYDEELTTVLDDEDDVATDLDHDSRPETVNILGHAPGIATGFGSDVVQDLGAEGFSVRDNPLMRPVHDKDYPISTELLSDEAAGLRDVDEMGAERDLDRLADRGAALEEQPPPKRRRGATRR